MTSSCQRHACAQRFKAFKTELAPIDLRPAAQRIGGQLFRRAGRRVFQRQDGNVDWRKPNADARSNLRNFNLLIVISNHPSHGAEHEMKSLRTMTSVAALLMMSAMSQSNAEPLTTMDEVGAAIRACWTPPAGISNATVTLSFSFNRDGQLIGPPEPTAINVPGDETTRQTFVDAATKALEGCMPLSFAPAIAEGIGGAVFTMEFASTTGQTP